MQEYKTRSWAGTYSTEVNEGFLRLFKLMLIKYYGIIYGIFAPQTASYHIS
jgi:hypothetical protein